MFWIHKDLQILFLQRSEYFASFIQKDCVQLFCRADRNKCHSNVLLFLIKENFFLACESFQLDAFLTMIRENHMTVVCFLYF